MFLTFYTDEACFGETFVIKHYYVICKQRVSVFHQGIQTRENGMKHEREARVFYCFRVFGPLMKHEKRVVYITSQTKTFHWLFNLLSVIKILIVVF